MVKNGYKQTEVGVIPEDWTVEELDSIIDIVTVKTESSNVKFYLSTENILPNFEGVDFNININRPNSVTQFRVDDILFSNIRPYLKKAYYASFDGGCSNDVFVFRSKSTYYSKYIFHLIASNKFVDYVMSGSKGTKMPRGDRKQLLRYKQPIPPTKEEQQNIATALGDIDGLITSLEKLLEKKQAIKQGAMQKLLEPKEDWTKNKIKDLCSITTGKSNTQDQNPDGKYEFYIRSEQIARSNKYLFDCEAVLTIGDGNIGKVFHYVNGKFDLHQRVYMINNFSGVYGMYFYYYFSFHFYERVMQMSAKATVDSVRLDMISEMSFPLPSIEEQKNIAKTLSDMDLEIKQIEKRILKAKNIKEGMMQQLLSGAIRLL